MKQVNSTIFSFLLTICQNWFCDDACLQHYRDHRDASCACLQKTSNTVQINVVNSSNTQDSHTPVSEHFSHVLLTDTPVPVADVPAQLSSLRLLGWLLKKHIYFVVLYILRYFCWPLRHISELSDISSASAATARQCRQNISISIHIHKIQADNHT